jgi:hypothetical protein
MALRKWSHDRVREEAKAFSSRQEFHGKSRGAYKYALRHGILDDVCGHMAPRFAWTMETVAGEAAKYGTRHEFMKGSNSAYQWAVRNGVIDALIPPALNLWCMDTVKEEARKYNAREAFRVGASGAAQWAMRNGHWDEVCAHMDRAGNTDADAVYGWQVADEPSVFKFGVTSQRLGRKRIDHVANELGVKVGWVDIRVCGNAYPVEADLLSLGKPFNWGRECSGGSEFRQLQPHEIEACEKILSQHEEASA